MTLFPFQWLYLLRLRTRIIGLFLCKMGGKNEYSLYTVNGVPTLKIGYTFFRVGEHNLYIKVMAY